MSGNTLLSSLFSDISALIDQAQSTVVVQANYVMTLLFWKIGRRVNEEILQNQRADYGKQIVSTLSTQLSWSHFVELLPLKSHEARLFYARQAATGQLGVRDLRHIISRKTFERTAIADTRLAPDSPVPPHTFKDSYLFDFLGLKNDRNYYLFLSGKHLASATSLHNAAKPAQTFPDNTNKNLIHRGCAI
jgi:hypothetical protein